MKDHETLLSATGGLATALLLAVGAARGAEEGTEAEKPRPTWDELIAMIPAVPESPDQAFFGARLTRTMSLLETSHLTGRPVRIHFYGQSIVCQYWTDYVIQRLRERFPKAEIETIKRAIPGYQVPSLLQTIRHDVLRARPDLVVFYAYGGNEGQRERLVQMIRRETTADIVLYTHHIARRDMKADGWMALYDDSAANIRRIAQKYDCELVDAREEWKHYLAIYPEKTVMDFVSDGLHLNQNGCILLAQLVERHFRTNTLFTSRWSERVRYFDCLTPWSDRVGGELVIEGEGWTDKRTHISSNHAGDRLRLTFVGNRIDLLLPSGSGEAHVLIDGRPPSEHNLYHATRPMPDAEGWWASMTLRRVFEGPDLIPEEWTLTFTEIDISEFTRGDGTKDNRVTGFRYTLHGSQTGPDGEGGSDQVFVSNSGRMTIRPDEFSLNPKHCLKELKPGLQLRWKVVADHAAIVHNEREPEATRYVTVADGLPYGEHELIVTVKGGAWFSIKGVEVHRPPLARIQKEMKEPSADGE